jgi:hypothetical protein
LYSDFWDGWEQQHPDPAQQINWQPLLALRNYVLNTSNAAFRATASANVDLDNVMDYYLFIYLVGAVDNHGKNMFWLQESAQAPFSIVPWDLDASWGRDFDNTPVTTIQTRTNRLFNRLLALEPDNYTTRLKSRWQQLRAGAWATPAISALVAAQVAELSKTDVIALDNAQWDGQIDLAAEEAYINNWMQMQHRALDSFFVGL